ncbi:hypothetical protein [Methylorubrum thiocyanatum]|uniref:hypothetical protein n=1 Tax=Methylorubrum thiocyanatum TaxID=47958 RepID=UPI003F7E0A72
MSKLILAPGVVAGVLALAGALSAAFGYPLAGAILADPGTAASTTMVVTGVIGLVAAVLGGIRGTGAPSLPAPAVAAGLFALVSALANAAGYPLAGAALSDPGTASQATAVLTGLGAVLAGVLPGLRKPAA